MTVWEDRAALSQFVFGDVHDTAIMEAMRAVAGGRSFTTTVSVEQLPLSWRDAEGLMDKKAEACWMPAGQPTERRICRTRIFPLPARRSRQ